MVVSSLASCVLASILIVATGTTQKYGIYAGTGIIFFYFASKTSEIEYSMVGI